MFVLFFFFLFFFYVLFFYFFFFFFFQAEDGIRDLYVTGVQTCALPISADVRLVLPGLVRQLGLGAPHRQHRERARRPLLDARAPGLVQHLHAPRRDLLRLQRGRQRAALPPADDELRLRRAHRRGRPPDGEVLRHAPPLPAPPRARRDAARTPGADRRDEDARDRADRVRPALRAARHRAPEQVPADVRDAQPARGPRRLPHHPPRGPRRQA